jgi:hypothetical protein
MSFTSTEFEEEPNRLQGARNRLYLVHFLYQ